MIKSKPNINVSSGGVYGTFAEIAAKHNAINFTVGAPEFDTPEWIVDRANFHMKNGKNQYAPGAGALPLRQAMVTKTEICYGTKIDVENVAITIGAQEALFGIVSSYVDNDDEVIMFDPIFDPYLSIVKFNRGKGIRLDLLPNGKIDLDALANAITEKTKVIILNSPHNPMGSIISKQEYQEVAKIIKNKDIVVISDEVYEHIYAGERFVSAIEVPELWGNLVVTQSLGKTYNLTGWRLGVAISTPEIIKSILSVKGLVSFSSAHPLQLAIADGILEHPEYYQNLHKLYKKQNNLLRENLKESKFNILNWQGSPFQLLEYNSTNGESDYDFAIRLIKEHGVGIVPISSLFERPQHGLFRLCFAKRDDSIIEGAKILCQV